LIKSLYLQIIQLVFSANAGSFLIPALGRTDYPFRQRSKPPYSEQESPYFSYHSYHYCALSLLCSLYGLPAKYVLRSIIGTRMSMLIAHKVPHVPLLVQRPNHRRNLRHHLHGGKNNSIHHTIYTVRHHHDPSSPHRLRNRQKSDQTIHSDPRSGNHPLPFPDKRCRFSHNTKPRP
jgi:hypothetical protein